MKNIIFVIFNFLFVYTNAGSCQPKWCINTDATAKNERLCSCKTRQSWSDYDLCGTAHYGKYCLAFTNGLDGGCLNDPKCTNTDRTAENPSDCACKLDNNGNWEKCSYGNRYCKAGLGLGSSACFSTPLPRPSGLF